MSKVFRLDISDEATELIAEKLTVDAGDLDIKELCAIANYDPRQWGDHTLEILEAIVKTGNKALIPYGVQKEYLE